MNSKKWTILEDLGALTIIGIGLLYCSFAGARTSSVSSEDALDDKLDRHSYVVVMFYGDEHETDRDKRKDLRREVKTLRRVFGDVSDDYRYKKAKVKFILVDVDRKGNHVFRDVYRVLPAMVVIYKHGRLVTGDTSRLRGTFSGAQLHELINTTLGDEIRDRLDAYQRELELREQEQRSYRSYYPAYAYYGAPYWYGWYGYPSYGYSLCW